MTKVDDLVGMEEISEEYSIPLSTLYKLRSDRYMKFPKRVEIAKKDKLSVFNKYQIDFWFRNVYLKYKEMKSKYDNQNIIDDLLKDLMI